MSKAFNKRAQFQKVAHRGFSADYCENTLVAFQKALEAGASMIELDVKLTKDAELIVFHDSSLRRLTGSWKTISRSYWKDLQELTLFDKKARKQKEGKVLKLTELFAELGDRCYYYLELKPTRSFSQKQERLLVQKVVAAVKEAGLLSKVLFVAFEFSILESLKKDYPEASIGWNFQSLSLKKKYQKKLEQWDVALCPREDLVNEKRLQFWNEEGFAVFPWVVNDLRRMQELRSWGIQGITSDEVSLLAKLEPSGIE